MNLEQKIVILESEISQLNDMMKCLAHIIACLNDTVKPAFTPDGKQIVDKFFHIARTKFYPKGSPEEAKIKEIYAMSFFDSMKRWIDEGCQKPK